MNLSWKTTIIVLAVLGGAAYLGVAHVFSGEYVSGIFSAIVASIITGHFALSTPKTGSANDES